MESESERENESESVIFNQFSVFFASAVKEGVRKTVFYLGLYPKLWVGGGQES